MVKLRSEDIADAVLFMVTPRSAGGGQSHAGACGRTDLVTLDAMATARWVYRRPVRRTRFPLTPRRCATAGQQFLTDAFRASGALAAGQCVAAHHRFPRGRGAAARVARSCCRWNTRPAPGLHTELFVKFSRDFDNPMRDRGKTQMEPEVRFASLSRAPGFPIAVPSVQFGDYHRQTGTGILITERIRFGGNGIESQYHKCLDYEMPEPLEHYRALLTALARLAGTHRAGRLPADLTAHFPLDVQAATVGERPPLRLDKLDRRLPQLAEFAEAQPGLLPANVDRRVPGAPARGRAAVGSARGLRGRTATGGRVGLCRAVPLERQRRQRLVLATTPTMTACTAACWTGDASAR